MFPDKLHQVWVNIINNALHSMDYKGRLIISVAKSHDKVLVSITDNVGIPSISASGYSNRFHHKEVGEEPGWA